MEETHVFCPWDGKRYTSATCDFCNKPRYIKKPQWKKILYEKQPFEDTYVDENFLNSLVTTEDSIKYDFWSLVDSTAEIAFALNSLILFLETHEIAQMEYISDNHLLIFGMTLLVLGYIAYISLLPADKRTIKPIRVCFLLLGTLYTLCPVLATINKNYANDTIFLMTFIFSILHLAFYDYSFVKNSLRTEKKYTPDVKSMNFALIAVILLSSRVNSLNYVYFLLGFGFMYKIFRVFGFMPYFRSAVYYHSPVIHSRLGVGLCLLNTWVVSYFSYLLSGLVIFTYFFIRYLGPLWLISVCHYKNEIRGPWDLPVIKKH